MDQNLQSEPKASSLEPLAVTIKGAKGTTQTQAQMEYWPRNKKLTQGLKALGISWGLAVISVFIPILHFVLVPLFILAGPVALIFFLRKKTTIAGGEGACPDCGSPVKIHRTVAEWPIKEVCEGDYHHVQILPADQTGS